MKKTTKKTTKQEPKSTVGHTFKPADTFDPTARARAAMVAGRNDNYQALNDANFGKLILLNFQTVTLQDFLSLSASLGVSVEQRRDWFFAFTDEAIKAGRLKEIPSLDARERVFRVIG